MKILSVRQPWAHLIIHGGKFIENRTWNTTYRGPLMIHATLGDDEDAIKAYVGPGLAIREKEYLYHGGIIGIVDLWNVVKNPSQSELEAMPGALKWYQGPHGWLLRDPQPLPFCRIEGQLGLWNPPDLILKFYKREIDRITAGWIKR